MKNIALQFYAAPEEIYNLVREAVSMNGVLVAYINYNPFAVDVFEGPIPVGHPLPNQIGFFFEPPIRMGVDWNNFLEANPNGLYLAPGRLEDGRLYESFLAGQTEDQNLLKKWRRIAKAVEKSTLPGVWVVNPRNRGMGFYRQFRYTYGALKLFDLGIKTQPPAGTNLVFLRDPRPIDWKSFNG